MLEERRVPVIVPSGSCASMIRHGYLELLRDEPAALERLAGIGRRSPALSGCFAKRSGGGFIELLGGDPNLSCQLLNIGPTCLFAGIVSSNSLSSQVIFRCPFYLGNNRHPVFLIVCDDFEGGSRFGA